jgi:protoporphyrinogen IX oxidase
MYAWLKALHIIAVIAWMAGMLYLPRLLVYHAGATPGSEVAETFKVMERRLLRLIINPAMVVTLLVGFILAIQGGWFRAGWFHAKLTLVVVLVGVHGFLAATVRRFAAGKNTRSPRFYRIVNEIPTVLMIVIVVLVAVKPF